jgi:hypothetical protein
MQLLIMQLLTESSGTKRKTFERKLLANSKNENMRVLYNDTGLHQFEKG